jgi:hypothetical protein
MAKLNIFYILQILKNLKIEITVVTTNNHPADPLEPTNVPHLILLHLPLGNPENNPTPRYC